MKKSFYHIKKHNTFRVSQIFMQISFTHNPLSLKHFLLE